MAACEGNPLVISGFPSQRVNNVEILCRWLGLGVEHTVECPVCCQVTVLDFAVIKDPQFQDPII